MKWHPAHLVFGASVLCLALAGFRGVLGGGRPLPVQKTSTSGDAFSAALPSVTPAAFVPWKEPEAQSAGREWIFEVFTPPIIYFDAERQRFTLRPPLEPEAAPVFGASVSGIQRVPYRLQYAGHHGEPGRYFIEIRDLADGAYYRGTVGERFEDGAFSIKRFVADVRRVQPPDRPWATPSLETFVELEVIDEQLGESVRFGREPLMLPDPVALVVPDATGAPQALAAGTSVNTDDGRFTVESIDEAARQVTLAKYDASEALVERKTFTLEPAPEPSGR